LPAGAGLGLQGRQIRSNPLALGLGIVDPTPPCRPRRKTSFWA